MHGAQPHDPEQLDEALRLAPALTPALFRSVMQNAGARLWSLRQAGKAARIDCLIESHAWTDAALALIELAIPQWSIRRIIHTDGVWHCSLSRQPNLPIELDDMAEASHAVLPLAVLRAFVATRRSDAVARQATSPVPQIRSATEPLVYSYDNYS
jgi:hypothetical protein